MSRRPKHSKIEVVGPKEEEEEEEESYAEYGNKLQAAITAVCDPESYIFNRKLIKKPISFHCSCSRHNSAPISSVRPLIIGVFYFSGYMYVMLRRTSLKSEQKLRRGKKDIVLSRKLSR